jgi:hypothetical protein
MKKLSFILIFIFSFYNNFAQNLVINEFMSHNQDAITDEDDHFEDWIELFNPGSQPINIKGYHISDNENNPLKWQFPEVIIPSKGYLWIWASGKDRKGSQLHTNFKIDRTGETLILSDSEGKLLDRVEGVELRWDWSYGRYPDGSENWIFFERATPGRTNLLREDKASLTKDEITFSQNGGFYIEPFDLTLSAKSEYTIHYTLDGSEPTRQSPIYSVALSIDKESKPNNISTLNTIAHTGFKLPNGNVNKCLVIRAKGFTNDGLETGTFSNSYYINDGKKYTFPVISIITDSSNLFDHKIGIYVLGETFERWLNENPGERIYEMSPANYKNKGIYWEAPASFELFGVDGEQKVISDFALRINGNLSRAYPQKSLRVVFNKDIEYDFFKDDTLFSKINDRKSNVFRSLIVRNAGNDYKSTIFRDVLSQGLAKQMNVEVQGFLPAVVFLNGEYWGLYDVRDRTDRNYISNYFGVPANKIDYLEHNAWLKEGSNKDYKLLLKYVQENPLSAQEKYEYVKSQIDIENFINYFIAQMYFANDDWPHNNIQFWRYQKGNNETSSNKYRDGRWRWFLKDTDYGFGRSRTSTVRLDMVSWVFNEDTPWPDWSVEYEEDKKWPNILSRNLIKNEEFKLNFINRLADCLNTTFLPSNVTEKINMMEDLYKPEFPEHFDRWNIPEDWENNIQNLRNFANLRTSYMYEHTVRYFNLSGLAKVTLAYNDSHGVVSLNTLNIESGNWEGTYFKDIPITLKAVAKPGFKFVKWEGTNDTNPELIVTLSSDATFTPLFERSQTLPEPHELKKNPYIFTSWSATSAAATYPPNMIFHQTDTIDPKLEDEMNADWVLPYDYNIRSRINGLEEGGISFINTANPQDTPEAGYVGAAVLALNTSGITEGITINFNAGTVTPNKRVYGLRLQYKIGKEGIYNDILNDNGNPVEYLRNEEAGHQKSFRNILLPLEAHNKSEVYLRWKYYYIETEETGARAELRLDQIKIFIPLKYPETQNLFCSDFSFSEWSPQAIANSFPEGMMFYQTSKSDPKLDDEMESVWTMPYSRENRSRINGLGTNGISFINTANSQPEMGTGYLGAAIVSVKTKNLYNVNVKFTAGTVTPNNREYRLILQYRIGEQGDFINVTNENGDPVEYIRNLSAGHEQEFDVVLPEGVNNQDIVQIRWKYYYIEEAEVTGARAELRLDNISIKGEPFVDFGSSAVLCNNEKITLGTNELTGLSFQWYKDNTLISGSTFSSFEVSQTGQYYVKVKDVNNCEKESKRIQVTVITVQKPTVQASQRQLDYLLTSSSATGNQWYKDQLLLAGQTSQTLSVNQPGVYTVKVLKDGCTSEPSEGTVITNLETTNFESFVKTYPNPVSDKLFIEYNFPKPVNSLQIRIIDIKGVVKNDFYTQSPDINQKMEVKTLGWAKGIYFLQVIFEDQILIKKILKE